MRIDGGCKLSAGFEKSTIRKAVEKIYAVYSSGADKSPGGNEYPCTRVINRMYWYRRKTLRCKLGYHLFSVLVVVMPLASTAIKIIDSAPNPPRPLDYADIILTSLTSVLAFMLGHFRFLEKWKRYRKILEEAIHLCSSKLVDDTKLTYDSAVELLVELEHLFINDTQDWTPDPDEKKNQPDQETRKGGIVDQASTTS